VWRHDAATRALSVEELRMFACPGAPLESAHGARSVCWPVLTPSRGRGRQRAAASE
jgi:hypothetical protein